MKGARPRPRPAPRPPVPRGPREEGLVRGEAGAQPREHRGSRSAEQPLASEQLPQRVQRSPVGRRGCISPKPTPSERLVTPEMFCPHPLGQGGLFSRVEWEPGDVQTPWRMLEWRTLRPHSGSERPSSCLPLPTRAGIGEEGPLHQFCLQPRCSEVTEARTDGAGAGAARSGGARLGSRCAWPSFCPTGVPISLFPRSRGQLSACPWGAGPGTWCPGARGFGVALFAAGGSHPTPTCFPPKTLVPRSGWWVLRPPGPASRELGEALTVGVSWGSGGDSWNICVLACQPLALIRLILGFLPFLGKLGVSGSFVPRSTGWAECPRRTGLSPSLPRARSRDSWARFLLTHVIAATPSVPQFAYPGNGSVPPHGLRGVGEEGKL